eukprot:TRINITY_DN13411_c0_g1_i5.p1 TRINITY_DN13411_c0_g1~~TRINITY_DN13411_c0_g1_i5.p1  ORF type:complete len:497 (+),score=122.32 TRINITY_DN13411_c0_g1_i5:41-1492(+)
MCIRDRYRTPSLNDKLYLHYRGWSTIQNLESYTGAKCIWLEANGIVTIENLEPCKENLRQLFLQQNCIQRMSGLEQLEELVAINLSENLIKRVEGISNLTKLNSLQLSQNYIEGYDDLEQLVECQSLSSIELNKNKIEDPRVIDIFARLPNLKVLKLDGNPITRKLQSYRKSVICRLKNLTYLDDRPVFPDERLMAEAWGRGGIEAEKIERTRQRKFREWTEKNRHVQFFKYIESAKKERRAQNKTVGNAGWQPANGQALEQVEVVASKKREVIAPRQSEGVRGPTSTAATGKQAWTLPRKECKITDASPHPTGAERSCSKSQREQKRASRQARLQKAMSLVQGQEMPAPRQNPLISKSTSPIRKPTPSTAQLEDEIVIEEVEEEGDEPTKSQVGPKKLWIQEIDSSLPPGQTLLIGEGDSSKPAVNPLGPEGLREAAKAHCAVGKSGWGLELDEFGREMEMEPDEVLVEPDATQVLDLDELD